ncbi:hypothetical protein CLBKND_03550 [Methylorubrum aminovorans]
MRDIDRHYAEVEANGGFSARFPGDTGSQNNRAIAILLR